MKPITKFFAVAAAAVSIASFASTASAAVLITIGLSQDGGAITSVASANDNVGVVGLTFGDFNINNISASVGVLPDLLNSNSLNTRSTGTAFHSLKVYITGQNYTFVNNSGWISALTSNALTAGFSVQEQTFYNANNALFGVGGTQLANFTFNAIGAQSIGALGTAGPAPYSLTHVYTINAPGAGSANSTIDIFAIPEPTTWALMIMGFGGVGAMVRSRRRQAAFA